MCLCPLPVAVHHADSVITRSELHQLQLLGHEFAKQVARERPTSWWVHAWARKGEGGSNSQAHDQPTLALYPHTRAGPSCWMSFTWSVLMTPGVKAAPACVCCIHALPAGPALVARGASSLLARPGLQGFDRQHVAAMAANTANTDLSVLTDALKVAVSRDYELGLR